MSALAEALLAAQRSAIGTLVKAYVAGAFEDDGDAGEEREDLAALERERRDDAREAAAERAYWQDVGLESAELVALETWRWSR